MAKEPVERRERILLSAATLFARKGVAATTVREIADEVGILSGSLYHHFESKEAIVDEVISSYLEDLRSRYKQVLALDVDPRTRLHDLVVASLEVAEAHPPTSRTPVKRCRTAGSRPSTRASARACSAATWTPRSSTG